MLYFVVATYCIVQKKTVVVMRCLGFARAHTLSPQKLRLTSVAHKFPLCNKGNLRTPDIGRVFYRDSDMTQLHK